MTTTFHSTRSTTDSLTAKQAIRKGIADDGGLFVSDALGKTKVDVASLPGKSYQQIAAEVLGRPARAIGSQIYDSKIYLETPDLFAWTLVVILLSVLLERLAVRFVRWAGKRSMRVRL